MYKRSLFGLLFCLVMISAFVSWRPDQPTRHDKPLRDSSERNVIYGHNISSNGKDQGLNMDIFYPPDMVKGKTYPMILLMHGGTFMAGDKTNLIPHCRQLADSGFVAVTINYRLGWNAFSTLGGCDKMDVDGLITASYRALQDTHAAMRFLVQNAAQYHIDTKWLFIGGVSAGGVLALDLAYLDQKFADDKMAVAVKALGKIDTASNSIKAKFKIKGICNMWGALPDSTLITRKNALPTIFYHGTNDHTVPYDKGYYMPNCTRVPELYGSACLYRQTLATGQVAVLNTSIGGKHGPVEFTPAVLTSNIACFFHRLMQGKATSASYTKALAGCR